MKIILILASALVLSACATNEPKVVYKEVKVPVVIPCIQNQPEKPSFPLQEATARDSIFILTKKALAEIELRKGYESELEAALVACKK